MDTCDGYLWHCWCPRRLHCKYASNLKLKRRTYKYFPPSWGCSWSQNLSAHWPFVMSLLISVSPRETPIRLGKTTSLVSLQSIHGRSHLGETWQPCHPTNGRVTVWTGAKNPTNPTLVTARGSFQPQRHAKFWGKIIQSGRRCCRRCLCQVLFYPEQVHFREGISCSAHKYNSYVCIRSCHPSGISWGWTRVVRSARTRDLDIGIDRYKDGREGRHEQTHLDPLLVFSMLAHRVPDTRTSTDRWSCVDIRLM